MFRTLFREPSAMDNRRRPRTLPQRLARFIYNPATGAFLGRNAAMWFQFSIFYAVFYATLSLVFGLSMLVFNTTLNPKSPKYRLDQSLIGQKPGMGYRPMSPEVDDGFFIKYNVSNRTSVEKWAQLLEDFLYPYQNQKADNFRTCNFSKDPEDDFVCFADTNFDGINSFGYNSGSPCVFVKLNKIFGWVPNYYKRYQRGMPLDLTVFIENLPIVNRSQVWVSCNGENPSDRKKIHSFRYYPSPSFAGYFYPYLNVPNYLSPLIAVQIIGLTPNFSVNIECRAWARNIYYVGGVEKREGSVKFEVLYLH